jgi:hypothetical protein
MRLEITDEDFVRRDRALIRAAAYFLLHTIGNIPVEDEAPTLPPVAPAATAPAVNTAVASAAANTSTTTPAPPTVPAPVSNIPPPPPASVLTVTGVTSGVLTEGMHIVGHGIPAGTTLNVPPPPPPAVPPAPTNGGDDEDDAPPSNIVNFPTAGTVPPPPSSSNAATAASSTTPPPVINAAGVGTVASAEYDSAGMLWDARIHQKAKGKKKDNTWKLIKGIDPATVQAVTAELAARKGASAPVSLPPFGTHKPPLNTVSVPPVANVPAPPGMPAPPVSAPVPVPPSPAVGGVGPYRALIDKITDLTRGNKISPAKVSEICQIHGAPSLMALSTMQGKPSAYDSGLEIVEAVAKFVDAAALGLL